MGQNLLSVQSKMYATNKLLIGLLVSASVSNCMETIYMKRSILDDQETSESGYSYEYQDGHPEVFTAYSKNDFENFGYPPVTLGKFVVNDEPIQYLPLMHYYPHISHLGLLDSYGKPLHDSNYNWPYKYDDGPVIQQGNYGLDSDNSKYVKEHGKDYKSDYDEAKGIKGESGYKQVDGFNKGLKGKYEKEGLKEYYNQEGGNKAGHYDEGAHYGNKYETGKENKGESFKTSKGHRKGSKTTGFHNVYHKDEYKKDHSFYDDKHESGHFNKYGGQKGEKSSEEGSFKKGGQLDKGFKDSKFGQQGFVDKGRLEEGSEGYKGGEGKESYYKDFDKYGRSRGNDNNKEYGYDDYESEKKYL